MTNKNADSGRILLTWFELLLLTILALLILVIWQICQQLVDQQWVKKIPTKSDLIIRLDVESIGEKIVQINNEINIFQKRWNQENLIFYEKSLHLNEMKEKYLKSGNKKDERKKNKEIRQEMILEQNARKKLLDQLDTQISRLTELKYKQQLHLEKAKKKAKNDQQNIVKEFRCKKLKFVTIYAFLGTFVLWISAFIFIFVIKICSLWRLTKTIAFVFFLNVSFNIFGYAITIMVFSIFLIAFLTKLRRSEK